MKTLCKDYSRVTRYIRTLHGGSQPILAQACDGLLYVVKFNNNLQGPNLPFNEGIGSELYRACGLAGTSWKPLLVTDSFLDQNPDCWMQAQHGPLRPNSGLCFGSRFLGGNGIRMLEILSETSFKRIRNRLSFWLAWLVDICAGHADNRQAIFLEDGAGRLDAFFIDHGHLFGGPKGELRRRFEASRYLDPRIYQTLSLHELRNLQRIAGSLCVDQLWQRVQALPEDWGTESALHGFAQCLSRLSTPTLLQNILDTMVEAQRQANEREQGKRQSERNPPVSVLRPGVQAAGVERRYVASRAGHPRCA
jgi:hypothetical protein